MSLLNTRECKLTYTLFTIVGSSKPSHERRSSSLHDEHTSCSILASTELSLLTLTTDIPILYRVPGTSRAVKYDARLASKTGYSSPSLLRKLEQI